MISLVAQLAAVIFSLGIAIYAFQFPILRKGAETMTSVVDSQHKRLSKKIRHLFLAGTVTIFSAIILKFIVLIEQCSVVLILHGLACVLISLIITVVCLYSLLPEIGLNNK